MTARAEIVQRLRDQLKDQQQLLGALWPQAVKWESMGLSIGHAYGLAFADSPETYQRVCALGEQMEATLSELESIDPTGPKDRDLATRMRWALGLGEFKRD